jgi:hypothetical protein
MNRVHGVIAIIVRESVTAEVYRRIIADEFLPRLNAIGVDPATIVLQQDSAPPHTARATLELLRGTFRL